MGLLQVNYSKTVKTEINTLAVCKLRHLQRSNKLMITLCKVVAFVEMTLNSLDY